MAFHHFVIFRLSRKWFARSGPSPKLSPVLPDQLASSRTDTAIKRILLIRPSALGDVCRSVAVAVRLKSLFPHAHLDWLIQDNFADAISAHPAIDGVLLFRRGRLRDGLGAKLSSIVQLRTELKAGNYDLVIDAQGLLRSGLMACVTRAKIRLGHGDAREWGWIGYTRNVKCTAKHAVERTLQLLIPLYQMLGRPVPPLPTKLPDSWKLHSVPEAKTWIAAQPWSRCRYTVLAPTSRWIAKAWPVERFDAVAARLLASGACDRIVVVGGPGEQPQCAPLLTRAAADPRIIDLVGRTTVGQLMATIEHAALVIANDSAAVHMAAGFDRPLVGLYGPTEIDKVGPLLRGTDVLRVSRDTDTLNYKDARNREMMYRIGVDIVEQMARQRLQIQTTNSSGSLEGVEKKA